MTPLERAFEFTVKNEGGYTNDPNDSGGPTNWGITQGDLSRHRGRIVSALEVKNMPKSEALQIYEGKYWKPLGCNLISVPEIAMVIFDMGLLFGIGIPPKFAQGICNNHGYTLTVDGKIGPFTARAINSLNPAVFINEFKVKCDDRFRDIVSRKPKNKVFLKGWLNRSNRLLTLVPKLERPVKA